ncbi:MAG: gamma carbonic anhydrase family protein [Chloroflexi bacterium]|nr:gamma carbonic anhydrase family protein [Chloroflexota bacterium]
MPIYEFEGKRPSIGASSYVHPTAVLIGDIVIGEGCWIGPNTTIRADYGKIRLGDFSNIQDNCVLHGMETTLGRYSHLGHACVVHGATLGEHILVAMNAAVLDGAVIGDWCVVAAGSVVAPRARIPAKKMVMGVPAAIVGDAPPDRERNFDWTHTKGYLGLPKRYREGLKEISLDEVRAQ